MEAMSTCRGVINIIFANDKFVKGENRKNFVSANIYSPTVSGCATSTRNISREPSISAEASASSTVARNSYILQQQQVWWDIAKHYATVHDLLLQLWTLLT